MAEMNEATSSDGTAAIAFDRSEERPAVIPDEILARPHRAQPTGGTFYPPIYLSVDAALPVDLQYHRRRPDESDGMFGKELPVTKDGSATITDYPLDQEVPS